ncbi:MAG: hypothetical protein KF891_13205 [Rhizobacter sp.]|nr:hypothetical protein [Rhizobacter sp.]
MTTQVTLIHGTFARGAPWTQEGSRLRSALAASLGDEVTFHVFLWSGDNSFAARADAAAALRAHLDSTIGTAPNDRHVVIAHSHGGNVALCALDGMAPGHEVDAVVCLATPFITARARQFGERSELVLGLAKVMGCVAVGVALAMSVTTGLGAGREGYWGIVALLLMALGGGAAWWVLSVLGRAWVAHATQWARTVSVSAPSKPTRLLVVRAAADEALEGLTVGHFPSTLLSTGWRAMAWLAVAPLSLALRLDHWAIERFSRRVIVGFGLWCAVALWTCWGFPEAPTDRKLIVLTWLAVVLLGSAAFTRKAGLLELIGFVLSPLFVLLGLAFVGLMFVLSLVALPFNTSARGFLDFARSAVWLGPVDISAEPAPPGDGEIRQASTAAAEGLQHSMPYDDPQALQWIATWLSAGEAAR